MPTVSKSNIQKEISNAIKIINEQLEKGDLGPQSATMNLVLFVAQASPRRWFVGYNFQDKSLDIGDKAIVPHPESFITTPEIVHIFERKWLAS